MCETLLEPLHGCFAPGGLTQHRECKTEQHHPKSCIEKQSVAWCDSKFKVQDLAKRSWGAILLAK